MSKSKQNAAEPTGAKSAVLPPSQLLDLIEKFLSEHSFQAALVAFQKQRKSKGWFAQAARGTSPPHSLADLLKTWQNAQPEDSGALENSSETSSDDESTSDESDAGKDVDMKDAEDDASTSESSSNDSDDDSESSSEDELATEAKKEPAVLVSKTQQGQKTLKRKAPSSSSSSDSESSSNSDSSESSSGSNSGNEPQAKKRKTTTKSTLATQADSDESSDGSDSGSEEVVDGKAADGSDSDSSLESDTSSSDSESDSEISTADVKDAAQVPLPDSSGSSSSEESESESELEAGGLAQKATKDFSDSSVTLDKTSPELKLPSSYPPLLPDPALLGSNGKQNKGQNVPFSRIPKNIKVDPRFASNAYVSMSYSQRAHEDLIVTKGKGFTKEKNKKKRGSYRGGAIDIGENKAVYFDD